jgi:cytochrome c-type biogenesis protein CcmE
MTTTSSRPPGEGARRDTDPSDVAAPRRARRNLVICIGVILAALGWIAVRGLTGSFVYYLTPTDVVVEHKASVDERVRVGGYVVPGSVEQAGDVLRFTVSDSGADLRVVDTGPVPRLFRPGQGVVLEGALGADGTFRSDTLLVKHDGEYRAPDTGRDGG